MSIDFSAVERRIDDAVSFFEHEEIKIVAEVVKKRIISRTLEGIDVNGSSFHAYSPRYARYGRARLGFRTDPVDLFRLGPRDPENPGRPHMLESIFLTTDRTLWFPPSTLEIARADQARREFFGVNQSDRDAALKAATEGMYAHIRRY